MLRAELERITLPFTDDTVLTVAVADCLLNGQDFVDAFHDYFHRANETGDYGVRRAVDEAAGELGLAFRGRFGGIAMFERVAMSRV